MKKEIIVCDICCNDNNLDVEELVEAIDKCELCGKDVCEECFDNINIGDKDTNVNILSFKCCNYCETETILDKKEDKAVKKEVRDILFNHFKKRLITKNLK